MITVQNKEEIEYNNVHIQRLLDMGVARGKGRKLHGWKCSKNIQSTPDWDTEHRYFYMAAGMKSGELMRMSPVQWYWLLIKNQELIHQVIHGQLNFSTQKR